MADESTTSADQRLAAQMDPDAAQQGRDEEQLHKEHSLASTGHDATPSADDAGEKEQVADPALASYDRDDHALDSSHLSNEVAAVTATVSNDEAHDKSTVKKNASKSNITTIAAPQDANCTPVADLSNKDEASAAATSMGHMSSLEREDTSTNPQFTDDAETDDQPVTPLNANDDELASTLRDAINRNNDSVSPLEQNSQINSPMSKEADQLPTQVNSTASSTANAAGAALAETASLQTTPSVKSCKRKSSRNVLHAESSTKLEDSRAHQIDSRPLSETTSQPPSETASQSPSETVSRPPSTTNSRSPSVSETNSQLYFAIQAKDTTPSPAPSPSPNAYHKEEKAMVRPTQPSRQPQEPAAPASEESQLQELFRVYASGLDLVFRRYASAVIVTGTTFEHMAVEAECMDFVKFYRMCRDFGVAHAKGLSQVQLKHLFLQVSKRGHDYKKIGFQQFRHVLVLCAEALLSREPFAVRYTTLVSRARALFHRMDLGDDRRAILTKRMLAFGGFHCGDGKLGGRKEAGIPSKSSKEFTSFDYHQDFKSVDEQGRMLGLIDLFGRPGEPDTPPAPAKGTRTSRIDPLARDQKKLHCTNPYHLNAREKAALASALGIAVNDPDLEQFSPLPQHNHVDSKVDENLHARDYFDASNDVLWDNIDSVERQQKPKQYQHQPRAMMRGNLANGANYSSAHMGKVPSPVNRRRPETLNKRRANQDV
ncbi:Hypothetical Protein FCC1311_032212 [Hondaea fermentalgiana]|uniref:Uncharacterized protein n=1 Tax=Hondaea fermentalgiana TaxID=2315210 RepID=A0A2R5GBA8_9STRA|nr:Hypothetical Protein FCC1311_032212 [Hondaea fermentalgiana]|eukprot:GBG26998.1 Hypothetical Protein FCC1311_032212 [Hondaea fermentalgiana]